MQLTPQQQATLHTWLVANATGLSDQAAKDALNAAFSPTYWVWRTTTPVQNVYNLVDDQGAVWDWTNYIAQSVTQQGAWTQMGIVGQQLFLSQQNVRTGILAIYGNTGAGKTNRDHCYAIGRRPATVFEQLFVTAVVSPPINTGNDGVAGNRGKTTNPDLLTLEGSIDSQTVAENR